MKAHELIDAHRYEDFASYCIMKLRVDPGNPGWLAEHGKAMLCMGRLESALEDYRQANELYDRRNRKIDPWLDYIGAIQWLLGKREDAIRTFRRGVDGILDGSIEFGDAAGGASHGLLLWYAGVTVQDEATEIHALRYLGKLSRVNCWPGPVAQFALGEKTWADVLVELGETANLDQLLERAKTDLLRRRELTQALFYLGVQKRSKGLHEECRAAMEQCAGLENPIIEVEWYLARGEIGKLGKSTREGSGGAGSLQPNQGENDARRRLRPRRKRST